ncbi:potassium-transporting ATPase subunit KdpB [Leptospira noguchii]|uniref:potassium-transporting ATPase subunit KdpB n=1 Tax=Leptospira noguchii TaxID=28182 RepID=UPI001F05CADF|nr:potassium-transporting ATPase subunit KdpB [Leptospira noguchii]MCH1913704.1 potassium-transporting ATPase subunit KdpB [Leptospira noguchii]MCH1914999.1 potassium-transporting ATPase subunit KdpB [Leptospira noguchii]UOG64912.1 potassium-transporting ATPase subunit KdpB [Leptospira noguchii]
MNRKSKVFIGSTILKEAILNTFKKLNPISQAKNPVMLVVFLGAIFTTWIFFKDLYHGVLSSFNLQISLWLWFTVLFANFAEAIAEGRGKARTDSLKKTRSSIIAKKLVENEIENVPGSSLKIGDIVICEAGDLIPGDGEILEGIASVDESAITGESAPVVRESGGDRNAVTGGTKVLSDRIKISITAEQGKTFLDQMIALVEGAKRQKTPNEISLTMLLSGLSFIFLIVVMSLPFFAEFVAKEGGQNANLSIPILISLLVCLIPTTIAGLLSAIGISGMERLIRFNVISKSGRAIEAAGDIDILLLDKTGTITLGNREAMAFYPARGVEKKYLADVAQLSSLADETPEGRSIVILAKDKFGIRERNLIEMEGEFIPFSASTKMSGVDLKKAGKVVRKIRKGAGDSIRNYLHTFGQKISTELEETIQTISQRGSTPILVTEEDQLLGVIELKDIVKGGLKERFASLRKMGIRTVMITGDNPLTAAAIAAEAGVDDFLAEATPETKLKKIREQQSKGYLVAMIGDGTNDAPALAQSDVGVAMNTGTQTAREAGNMIDLDSNPSKLIEIVEIGKQLLMTRGALTTFSIANDVAKYFAILPALFGNFYATSEIGPLSALNLMQLGSQKSAVLSAVIFNALVIPALIPLALKGVVYKPLGADKILKRNLLIFGLGGMIVPFLGIKCIDLILVLLGIS